LTDLRYLRYEKAGEIYTTNVLTRPGKTIH